MPTKKYLENIKYKIGDFINGKNSPLQNNLTTLRALSLEEASRGMHIVDGRVWRNGWSLVTAGDDMRLYVWDLTPDGGWATWRPAGEDDISFLKTLLFPQVWDEAELRQED